MYLQNFADHYHACCLHSSAFFDAGVRSAWLTRGMSQLLSPFRILLERIVGRSRVYSVYGYDPAQGSGRRDDAIEVFNNASPPPAAVQVLLRRHAGILGAGLMRRRMVKHGAVLLSIVRGNDMLGYGWIQTWRPLLREFGWLAGTNARCLGPYWTHPQHRGKGVYGRLLLHSLAECRDRGWNDVYIWAEADNASSIRGIEKAGFRPLGRHRVTLGWFCLSCHHVPLSAPIDADSMR